MPEIGRFISEDPWAGTITTPTTMNPYPYVLNNPLKYVDPLGLNPQPSWAGCLSEQELRNQLDVLVKEHLSFVEENKNIGFYSTNESIDIVLKYDSRISQISKELGVQKELIQTVLFKELRMYDFRDAGSDAAVIEYYRFNHELERYNELSFWQKLFVGTPKAHFAMREDSSTGLGQIFAKTAIEAYNYGIDNEYISGNRINYDDWHQREKVWNELRDDEMNIYYAGLVLKFEAGKLEINLGNATNNQLEKVLARYNGKGDRAAEYGRETKQYYDLFKLFNK